MKSTESLTYRVAECAHETTDWVSQCCGWPINDSDYCTRCGSATGGINVCRDCGGEVPERA